MVQYLCKDRAGKDENPLIISNLHVDAVFFYEYPYPISCRDIYVAQQHREEYRSMFFEYGNK